MKSSIAEKVRSRSRLGADTARVWARELCLGNPYAKSVLLAVANYMNEDGAAWPGIATIARDTDISEDTVVARLRWLESIGAVALLKSWCDEHGRRNYDGRGRVTSSEIRFLFDADIEQIEAKAAPEKPPVLRGAAALSHAQKVETGTRQQRELNESQEQGVSPVVAPEQPPTPSARTGELKPDSPQSSPLPSQSPSGDPPKDEIPYEQFSEVYGEGSVRPLRARTLWDALTDAERKIAIRGARGYRSQRLSAKKSLIDPERFLRSRELWTEFANRVSAFPDERAPAPVDSREGLAWRCLWKLAGLSSPMSFQVSGITVFSVPVPMPAQIMALADCIDRSGAELGQWQTIEGGSNAIGAWRELLSKTIKRGLALRPGENCARVPAEFPPRADGSWPEVKRLATESELNEFAKTG